MFNFFKRKTPKKAEADIESVIFDIAEYNRDQDYNRLYDLLAERRLFMPVDPSSFPESLEHEKELVIDASMEIKAPTVLSPDGETYAIVSTTANHPFIQPNGYALIQFEELIEMCAKSADLCGLLIQGQTSFVGFDNDRLQYIKSYMALASKPAR